MSKKKYLLDAFGNHKKKAFTFLGHLSGIVRSCVEHKATEQE